MSQISYSFLDEQMTEDDREFYLELGNRVATLRKEIQMTQVQLAKVLGISQQLMASYEVGRRKVPASVLPKLAKTFGVSVEALLGMKEKAAKPGPTPKLQRQMERLSGLPRSKQRFVMEMLETVIRQQQSSR